MSFTFNNIQELCDNIEQQRKEFNIEVQTGMNTSEGIMKQFNALREREDDLFTIFYTCYSVDEHTPNILRMTLYKEWFNKDGVVCGGHQ